MATIRLGDLLVRAGVITEGQLQLALQQQKQNGARLGVVLVRASVLSEDLLVKALSRQLGLPRANLAEPLRVPPQVFDRLDRTWCEHHHALPVTYIPERRTLVIAVSEPSQLITDDVISRTGLSTEVQLAGDGQLQAAIAACFAKPSPTSIVPQQPPPLFQPPPNTNPTSMVPAAVAGPAVQLPAVETMSQAQQVRLLRVVVELLAEKGVLGGAEVNRLLAIK
jgi:hypothetical protein